MFPNNIDLNRDVERIQQIPIIPLLLDVVCQTTGMGFAAVARVTQDRWIACSVRDMIQFGLGPGEELDIKTTICNEIQQVLEPVVIDHVQQSEQYCNHPTPLMYGFQSYISFPIILKNGEFFGTLCAIDPKPAQLSNSKVMGMFSLFAELIAFHLQQVELLEQTQQTVQDLGQQLTDTQDENRQYRYVSSHHLQEPLRKLGIFSEMLLMAADRQDFDQTRDIALKISASSQRFAVLIKGLSDFSVLNEDEPVVGPVDLNQLLSRVTTQLRLQIEAMNAAVEIDTLPTVAGIAQQLEQLFYHLISNALKFSRQGVAPRILISTKELTAFEPGATQPTRTASGWVNIQIQDNGIGIDPSQLEKIFTIFAQSVATKDGRGLGLAYCRKIVRNHGGMIKAQSVVGQGTTIFIILPN